MENATFPDSDRLYGTLFVSKVRTDIDAIEVTSTMYKRPEVNDE